MKLKKEVLEEIVKDTLTNINKNLSLFLNIIEKSLETMKKYQKYFILIKYLEIGKNLFYWQI